MPRSSSSSRWLHRHVTDSYVRRARARGYRSRAAYKLLEIDRRERLLAPGARVVDLGAAPGGWAQVAAARVGREGRVVAVDLLGIAPISGVTVLRGDFMTEAVRDDVRAALGGRRADVVLSDLSPNLSGIATTDQARAAELVRAAAAFCRSALDPAAGRFLCKLFQGAEFAGLLAELRRDFERVRVLKPAASRSESRETYLLASGATSS